jgi:uncharacterized OB-fold protein
VYTYTVIRQNSASSFRDWVPYAIGLVELDEGPRVFALIRGDEADLRVGAPAEVAFEDIGGTVAAVFTVGSGSPPFSGAAGMRMARSTT